MHHRLIAEQLLDAGRAVWSSVECDLRNDRWIVDANLRPMEDRAAYDALHESQRILKDVLPRCVGDSQWIATVRWANRVSYTVAGRKP